MVPSELSPNLLKAAKLEVWQSRTRSLGEEVVLKTVEGLANHEEVLIKALRLRLEGKRLRERGLTATSDYNNWLARNEEHGRRHDARWMEAFMWMVDLDTGDFYDEEGEPIPIPENEQPAEVLPFPAPVPDEPDSGAAMVMPRAIGYN